MAAEAARNVFMMAEAAMPSAASAEPALKPAQPNHRMPVPIIVSGRLWGGIGVLGIALAGTEDEHQRQRRGAGVDVDDGATGEVEGAHVGEPAAGEHPVGDRPVDQHAARRR